MGEAYYETTNRRPYVGDAERSGFSYFCNFDEIEDVAPCPGQRLLSLEDSGYVGFKEQIVEMRKTGWDDLADQLEKMFS